MKTDVTHDLKQSRPFANLEHGAQLSIIRTSSMLTDAFERMLKPHGITSTQFNVLRILRGAGDTGLCRNEIGDRMITRMPDVTRLLDRMEEAGYIARERSTEDRRMVRTSLADKGYQLLAEIDEEVSTEQRRPFRELSEKQLEELIEMLASVRQNI